MSDNQILFKREELYEKIWTTPIVRLAKEYGISDVALAKICKKLKVPRPPRGYWAKLEFKKKARRVPLPQIFPGEPTEYVHYDFWKPDFVVNVDSATVRQFLIERCIEVSDVLDMPHRLVKEARTILRNAKPAENGLLYCNRCSSLSMSVSPSSLDRALRIMDALIKGFEAEGFEVSAGSKSNAGSFVSISGEKVHFSINEEYRRVKHVPTREEKAERKASSFWDVKKYDYHPTSILSLKIEESGAYGKRKLWSDSKSGRLEEKVGEFLGGAVFVAHVLKLERQKKAEAEKKWEEERKRMEELEKLRAEERARLQELEQQATMWARSEQVRAFVRAVESAFEGKEIPEEQKGRITAWIGWARDHANRIDPLTSMLSGAKSG